MAKAAAAACASLLLLALVFANDTSDLPPDDLDGSGDDEDSFSGSGFESLPEEVLVSINKAEREMDSLTSASPSVATENQHPIAQEPESAEGKKTEAVPTTRAVGTEKPVLGPYEEGRDTVVSAEKTATTASTAVFLKPTHLPALHPATVASQASSTVIVPEVHDIPQAAPNATSDTHTIDPHHPHHHGHHHHGHHHPGPQAKTSTASVTQTIEPHMHHGHHSETTSATTETHGLDSHVHHANQETTATHGMDSHVHHDNQETTASQGMDLHVHHGHHPETTSATTAIHGLDSHVQHANQETTASHGMDSHVQHANQETTASHGMDSHVHHDSQETTATQGMDSHVHHGHHPETTSATTAIHGLDSHVHHANQETTATHDMDPHKHEKQDTSATSATPDPHMHHVQGKHVHHHDRKNATESILVPHLTTPDAHMTEEDDVINTTANNVASHGEDDKINVTAILTEDESEPEHADSKDDEGSGGSPDGAEDFFIEVPISRNKVSEENADHAVKDDGISDTSKGLMEQKGVLAAVIAGGVAGLVFAVCLVGFMLYRMKKKDEGSYSLEEPKQTNGGYQKPLKQEEFYA